MENTNEIVDMVFVKALEKSIGRRLSQEEIEQEDDIEIRLPSGDFTCVSIPRLNFPSELLSQTDLAGFVR